MTKLYTGVSYAEKKDLSPTWELKLSTRMPNANETLSHIKAEIKPFTNYWAPKSDPAPEIVGTSDIKSGPSQESNMDTSSTGADVDLATLHVPPPQDNTNHAAAQKPQSAIKNFMLTDDQWRAEVLWAMKTVKAVE